MPSDDPAEPEPRWSPRRLVDVPGLEALRDSEHTRLMFLGVFVGAVGGLVAGAYDVVMVWSGHLLLATAEPSTHHPGVWRALLGPIVGGLFAGVGIRLITKKRRPQGIADVIEGVMLRDGAVSLREGLTTAVASAVAVGGGLSGGREGPIVQFASAMVSRLTRSMNVSPQRARVLVAAGAAAGIAASFNTPVAGAFFALEILIGNFAVVTFAPVVAATVTGTVVGQVLLGTRISLHLPAFSLENPLDLLIYPVLGVLSALVSVAFQKLVFATTDLWERYPGPAWSRPAVAGALVGGVAALGFHQVMGNGYAFAEGMIGHGLVASFWVVVTLLVLKVVVTALAVSSGSGVGMFAPSLIIGALVGQAFGIVADGLLPSIAGPPGAYAMVGMGAVAAAVTQAPITMTLMLFEMTGNYLIILPLLLTIAVSTVVTRALGVNSIYVEYLARRGVRVDAARGALVMHELTVADVLRTDHAVTVRVDDPFTELARKFLARRVDEAYVLDADGRFVGFIDIQDVKALLGAPQDAGPVAGLAHADIPTLVPEMPLADTLSLFFRSGLEALPVLAPDRTLIGVLTERDVVGAYNREVLRKDSLLARVESGEADDRHTDFFELPDGHVMDRVAVTGTLAGHTLRELRLPARYGVTVIAVSVYDRATGTWDRHPAEIDLRLADGDHLVVMGPVARVRALQDDHEDVSDTQVFPKPREPLH